MNKAKLILIALGILAGVFILLFVVGIVITIVKFLFVVGLILLAVVVIRKLSGKSEPAKIEEGQSDRELNDVMRQLEELKRNQLTK